MLDKLVIRECDELINSWLYLNLDRQKMSNRYKQVIRMRFGIGCDKKTQRECAEIIGVSAPRIAQIENKAISTMRKSDEAFRALWR